MMMVMRFTLIAMLVAGAILLSGCTYFSALGLGAGAGIPVLGKALERHAQRGRVQDFAITLFRGKEARVSDYLGQPLVLNFWAEW